MLAALRHCVRHILNLGDPPGQHVEPAHRRARRERLCDARQTLHLRNFSAQLTTLVRIVTGIELLDRPRSLSIRRHVRASASAYGARISTRIPLVGSAPVSYTHLRAHATDSYLVCRLLLEKKKK